MSTRTAGERCLIIAEAGSVHDGSLGNAKRLIETATGCGADAVKFQTHVASAETLRDAPTPSYFTEESRYEYFERTGFTHDQWVDLKASSEKNGVEFLASPFSIEAVELLERVGVARYKIPSGEVTNLPLLEVVARTRKPILLSSGMSTWEELDEAVNTILRVHNKLTVLQCTSKYPCPYEDVGLNVMLAMRERYRLPVGLSDHTLTAYASLAAVTLGASVLERHLTFSRFMYGSDAPNSLEPTEFADVVRGVRAIETIMRSKVDKTCMANELRSIKATFEKSVVSLVDIPCGTKLTQDMVALKKPGVGLKPRRIKDLIGMRATRDIPRDAVIQEGDFCA